jgi:penicillin-binding protein 1A
MKAAWAQGAPQTPLPRPSPEAARHLVALPIDVHSGQRLDGRSSYDTRFDVRGAGGSRVASVSGAFMEYFRVDDGGRLNDTQERMTSRGFGGDDYSPFSSLQSWFGRNSFGPSGPSGSSFPNGYRSGPFSGAPPFEGGPGYQARPPEPFDNRPPLQRAEPFRHNRPGF